MPRGAHAEADSLFGSALAMYASLPGDQQDRVAQTKAAAGTCLLTQTRYAEAEPLLVDGYERLARGPADQRPAARAALASLVTLYDTVGQPANAAQYRALLPEDAARRPR